jgi:hypothetical protein
MTVESKCSLCSNQIEEGEECFKYYWSTLDPDSRGMKPIPVICSECYQRMKDYGPIKDFRKEPRSGGISTTDLSPEETRIIKELRRIDWGKLTIVKKGGAVVMITPAPDIKVSP